MKDNNEKALCPLCHKPSGKSGVRRTSRTKTLQYYLCYPCGCRFSEHQKWEEKKESRILLGDKCCPKCGGNDLRVDQEKYQLSSGRIVVRYRCNKCHAKTVKPNPKKA